MAKYVRKASLILMPNRKDSSSGRTKSFSGGDDLNFPDPDNLSAHGSGYLGSRRTSEARKKPHEYSFLIQDIEPTDVWVEQKHLAEISMSTDPDTSKIYKNKETHQLAHTKIVDKFSDDYFDDYLVEMGILDECHLKFEDRMNEIEILRKCQHENITRFYEAYFVSSKLWIFTEFCSGGSLDKLIFDLDEGLSVKQIHYVTSKVLSALVYLHEKLNYVHHDLRAANILVAHDGEVKLSNFSISAKQNDKLSTNKGRYSFIASPHWTPPETALSERLSDNANYVKADSWSLGITCIELAEKYPPNNFISPERVMAEIRSKNLKSSLKDPNKWPYDFNDFINRCLIRSPEQRPSASELIRHFFITGNASSKEEMVILLEKRKNLFQFKIKKSIAETQKSFDLLSFIRSDSETFIKQYFQELTKEIDACAENAIHAVKAKRVELIEQLSKRETDCLRHLKPVGPKEESELKEIETKFKHDLAKWNAMQVSTNHSLEINKLQETDLELDAMREEAERQVDRLRAKLLQNKNYGFVAKPPEENVFGELKIVDASEKVSLAKLTLSDDRELQHKFREKTKMIRLEMANAKGSKPTNKNTFSSISEQL